MHPVSSIVAKILDPQKIKTTLKANSEPSIKRMRSDSDAVLFLVLKYTTFKLPV